MQNNIQKIENTINLFKMMELQDNRPDENFNKQSQNQNIGTLQSELFEEALINNNIFTKRMTMVKVEWKFLNNKLKIELEKIIQDNQCCFQVLKDQNLHIDPILKFNGKQIILCGELDNYIYDAQIIEDNNKGLMEPLLNKDLQNSNIIYLSSSPYRQMRQEFEYFRSNITKIFEIAQKEKYESLVIPIFGQSSIFSFETACRGVLTCIIKQINHSLFTKNIYILEKNPQKLQIILYTLQDLLYPQRQTKFQWQFYEDCWIDYEIQINQQIDEAYEQYQKDNSKNEIEINFPYPKFPQSNLYEMEKDIIKFSDKRIIQVNLKTKLQRKVYFKLFLNIPLLDKDKFDFKFDQSINQQKNLIIIDIKSSEAKKLYQIEQQIRDLLEKNQQKFNWKVKNFKDDDLFIIEKKIRKRSIQFEGQIKQGKEIQIKCFNKKAKKLQDYLYDIEKQFIMFPQEWIPQEQNLVKVQLNNNDEDYKKVQQQFHQSYPNGRIFQINRIQNKILYENFINEKRKLMQMRQVHGQVLNEAEIQTYLWHGVKYNHPSIIYNSIKEAFKNNYCNESCYWGPGIYFASQAIYSKDYAYLLTSQQSVDYPNKLIFLLCEVATGKCASLASNNNIKEPPYNHDCVVGKFLDTDIYVLYGMDVRRAYPSFEIIFE